MPERYAKVDPVTLQERERKGGGPASRDLGGALGAENITARVWRYGPGHEMAYHRHKAQEEFYHLVSGGPQEVLVEERRRRRQRRRVAAPAQGHPTQDPKPHRSGRHLADHRRASRRRHHGRRPHRHRDRRGDPALTRRPRLPTMRAQPSSSAAWGAPPKVSSDPRHHPLELPGIAQGIVAGIVVEHHHDVFGAQAHLPDRRDEPLQFACRHTGS